MKDVIIGAIANYPPEKIIPYIVSVARCGFVGDKIMIVYNVPSDTVKLLHSYGWEVIEGSLQGHPHMQRLVDIYYTLRQSEETYRFVITTDVRDVVFQTNPSDYLERNLRARILVSSENVLYKDEPWGVKNILEGYGPLFLDRYKEQPTCNVGVLAGYHTDMMDLLLLNYLVSQAGDTTHFTDQSSFNFIIHNELVKRSLQVEGLDTNWALQVGTLPNPQHQVAYDVHIQNNTVMHPSGPFVVVHQYDRRPDLQQLINSTYTNS